MLEQFFTSFSWMDTAVVIQLVLTAASWVVLCHGLRFERGVQRFFLEFGALLAVIMVCNRLAMVLGGSTFLALWTVTQGVITAAYMALCSPYNAMASVVMWCSMYAGVCGISSIAGQFSMLTGSFIAPGALEGIARCVTYLLMLALAAYLRAFNFDRYRSIPQSGMALILVGDVIILAMTMVENWAWFSLEYHGIVMLAAAYISIFVMELVAIYAMYTLCREQEEILDLQAERQRLQSEKELAVFTEASLEDLRCIRHDLKNQYAYMQILLDSERYADLKDYFRQLSTDLPVPLTAIDCGNRAVNTILNMEIGKAKKEGITVEHQLVVPPVLPFADDDLCAIVANLMDNAIEECVRLRQQGREDLHMSIEIYPKRSYLFIVCHNSTGLNSLDRWQRGLRTTKKDPQLHGYGTRIVSKLSEKYNGCTEYSLENGNFTALVMLDMMLKEENQ